MSITPPPAGFTVPDFHAPLDLDAHLARVPSNATVKGTIAQSHVDTLRAAGLPVAKSYLPFRDYPMRELITLNVESVAKLYPDVPVREGLRRLGRSVFPAFTQTLLGKVMYGVFRGNIGSIFKVANKSFEITQNTGRVRTAVLGSSVVRLSFSNTHTFLSTYHLGILEGTLEACGVRGEVTFKATSETEGEFFIAWEERSATSVSEQRV